MLWLIKYFSSFAAVKLVKKKWGHKWLPSLFFANFTAAKDEKYFSVPCETSVYVDVLHTCTALRNFHNIWWNAN